MDVRILTLKNGINLMAKVAELAESERGVTAYVLEKPVMVQSMPPEGAGGQARLMMAPFLEFTEGFERGVTIQKEDVLTSNKPLESLAQSYARLFSPILQSSGLIRP